MTTKFIESGSDATFDLIFWSSSGTATLNSDSSLFRTGPRSISIASATGGVNKAGYLYKTGILADAGRRISIGFNFTDLPIQTASIMVAGGQVHVRITSAGVLQLSDNGLNQLGSNGSTLSTGVWYRLGFSYTVTSATINEFRLYKDGVLDISVSNATVNTGSTELDAGWVTGPTPSSPGQISKKVNVDDIYVDDGSDLTDTGNVRITAKLPNGNNVNNFDTNIGANPTNRWTNVNERPSSVTNGWVHNAISDVSENYTLQNAATGDIDLTGVTLVARSAWILAKKDSAVEYETPTLVRSDKNQNKTSGTSLVITLAGAYAAGSSVILTFTCDDTVGTYSVSDSAGNTYKEDNTLTALGIITKIFSAHNIIALAINNTITVTHPTLVARAGIAANFSNLATSNTVDLSKATGSGTSTSPSAGPSSPTTNQTNELIIGGYGGEGPNEDVWSDNTTGQTETVIGQNGTTGGGAASNVTAFMMYRNVTSTGTFSTDATINNSRDWNALVSCYKAKAKAGGTGTSKITNNGVNTAVTLTNSLALFTDIVDSATYPSNAAGIGMTSTNTADNSYLYECGMLIAYIPAAVGGGGIEWPDFMKRGFLNPRFTG